jgi:DNA primase
MNYTEARNIDIVNFLSKKGIQPTVIKGCQYSFKSPFRDESKPSFSVNTSKNLWYDFGVGEGGDIISLVRKMFNVDFREALRILAGNQYIVFEPKPTVPQKKLKRFKIKKAFDEIKSIYLISYLHTRCVNYQLVKHCSALCEVEFVAKSGKLISALGFKNDNGGYEMRNTFTKLSTSPKAISTIPGEGHLLNVFEGFMDYLSALTYYNVKQLDGTNIILNGVGQKKQMIEVLTNYAQVKLFADNDAAGVELTKEIKKKHSNVSNMAERIYPAFKDFNAFLCKDANNIELSRHHASK